MPVSTWGLFAPSIRMLSAASVATPALPAVVVEVLICPPFVSVRRVATMSTLPPSPVAWAPAGSAPRIDSEEMLAMPPSPSSVSVPALMAIDAPWPEPVVLPLMELPLPMLRLPVAVSPAKSGVPSGTALPVAAILIVLASRLPELAAVICVWSPESAMLRARTSSADGDAVAAADVRASFCTESWPPPRSVRSPCAATVISPALPLAPRLAALKMPVCKRV